MTRLERLSHSARFICPGWFAGRPEELRLQPRNLRWVLLGLILLAAVPRIIVACQLPAVCSDGYYYFRVADRLQQGRLDQAFAYLNLNVYPVLLLVLTGNKLDWICVGITWSVVASVLAVFPLFGWLRLQFNDGIAIAGCFLYCIHTDLIEISAEPIREPTFWLLLALSLYLITHAVRRLSLGLFALAGAAATLALYTRTEGGILVLFAIGLTALRMWSGKGRERLRLAGGLALFIGMTPALVLLANVTLLKHHPRWEWGRLKNFGVCWSCVRKALDFDSRASMRTDETVAPDGHPAKTVVASLRATNVFMHVAGRQPHLASVGATASPGAMKPPRPKNRSKKQRKPPEPPLSRNLVKYTTGFVRSVGPVHLILLVIGLVYCWKSTHRPAIFLLLLLASLLLLAIWIQLQANFGRMNSRYFLTVFLLLSGAAGTGLRILLMHLARRDFRLGRVQVVKPYAASVLAITIAAYCCIDAITSRHDGRNDDVQFGRWLQAKFGPLESVKADPSATRVAYAAADQLPTLISLGSLNGLNADGGGGRRLVILTPRKYRADQLQRSLARAAARGYFPIQRPDLPAARDHIVLRPRPSRQCKRQAAKAH